MISTMMQALVFCCLTVIALAGQRCYQAGYRFSRGQSVVITFPTTYGIRCRNCTCRRRARAFCRYVTCNQRSTVIKTSYGGTCEKDGKILKEGYTMLSPDGCNMCFCQRTVFVCTRRVCRYKESCKYKGVEYRLGVSFNIGCTRCTCAENDRLHCSISACKNGNNVPGCSHAGNTLQIGQSIAIISDNNPNCKKCTCYSRGVVKCAFIPCNPQSFDG